MRTDLDDFAYVDTETTGLDPRIHWAYELAYAIGTDTIHVVRLPHSLEFADAQALAIGRYDERGFGPDLTWKPELKRARREIRGKTIVGCNPAFDQEFLRKALGYQAWHYRLLDLEAWGAGVLGFDRPLGNKDLQRELRELGYPVEESDHTAEQDVRTLRQCHLALLDVQDRRSRRV